MLSTNPDWSALASQNERLVTVLDAAGYTTGPASASASRAHGPAGGAPRAGQAAAADLPAAVAS